MDFWKKDHRSQVPFWGYRLWGGRLPFSSHYGGVHAMDMTYPIDVNFRHLA